MNRINISQEELTLKTLNEKLVIGLLAVVTLISCSTSNDDSFVIDPRNFTENEISLADIADDIEYIPLDNDSPIGIIRSHKIVNGDIFLFVHNTGIMAYDCNGKFLRQIGAIGRGPGEYRAILSFAVDPDNDKVYVLHTGYEIMVFSISGNYIRSISLPKNTDPAGFAEVEIINSRLLVFKNINRGQATYNWIITDTLGKIIHEKENTIPPFDAIEPSREGNSYGNGSRNF